MTREFFLRNRGSGLKRHWRFTQEPEYLERKMLKKTLKTALIIPKRRE